MRVSVALATYNGEQYLAQQLASLASQSRVPDEIVVCDDGSTDSTLELVRTFAHTQRNIDVRIFGNDLRLGYAANFMAAMRRCTGDVIFLCDQDDVWFETKIETALDQFLHKPDTWLIVNDADFTDANLQRTGLTIGRQIESIGLPSSENFHGCCMSLRSSLFKIADPGPIDLAGHDGWINTIANCLHVRTSLDQPLQYYRRHGSNASSGVTTDLTKSSKWKLMKLQFMQRGVLSPRQASEKRLEMLFALEGRFVRDFDYLKDNLPDPASLGRALEDVRQKIKINSARLEFQRQGKVSRFVASTAFALRGFYRGFEGWKSWVRDVVG